MAESSHPDIGSVIQLTSGQRVYVTDILPTGYRGVTLTGKRVTVAERDVVRAVRTARQRPSVAERDDPPEFL